MELAKVTNENLISGLLLKYGKFNKFDLESYRDILFEKYGYRLSPFAVNISAIVNYIIKYNNVYYMIDTQSTRELFMEKQGVEIPNILDDINIEDVVLRKFEKIGNVLEHMVFSLFNSEEEQVINKLIDDMCLIYVWSCEEGMENVMELQLTSIGKEKLNSLKNDYKVNKEKR